MTIHTAAVEIALEALEQAAKVADAHALTWKQTGEETGSELNKTLAKIGEETAKHIAREIRKSRDSFEIAMESRK